MTIRSAVCKYNVTLCNMQHLLQGASNSTTPRTQIYTCLILLSNHLLTKLCLFYPFICVFTLQFCLKEASLYCCKSLLCKVSICFSNYVLLILMSVLYTFLCDGYEQSMEQTSSLKRTALMGLQVSRGTCLFLALFKLKILLET